MTGPNSADSHARPVRTTYVVLVEHETGEEPILSVSEGARIVSVAFSGTRDTAPVQKGVWRHQDDGTPCVSYPDSFDWTWTEEPLTCSNHGRVMTCVLLPPGVTS